VRFVAQLHRDREIKAGRTAADACDFHRSITLAGTKDVSRRLVECVRRAALASALSPIALKWIQLHSAAHPKTAYFKAVNVHPLILYSDERSPSPDSRRQVGRCLRHAFAVGDAGSFTSLLQAIGNDTGKTTRT
jgi:hypothetical protein